MNMAVLLAEISEWHVILVLIIVFLLFGGKKLPELAKGLGEAMKEFKKAQRDMHADEQQHAANTPPPAAPVQPQAPAPSAPQPPANPKLN